MNSYEIHLINGNDLGKPKKIYTFDENTKRNAKNVINSKHTIHPDDSIRDLKYKLVKEMGRTTISNDEIYLFYETNNFFDINKAFGQMTDPVKNEIAEGTDILVKKNFPDNFLSGSGSRTSPSDNYDLDVARFLERVNYYKMLGHSHRDKHDYLFVVNPYKLEEINVDNDDVLLQSQDGTRLIGATFNRNANNVNVVYATTAEDLLKFALDNGLDEKSIIKTYFPQLYERSNKIASLSELLENRINLSNENPADDDKLWDYFAAVDLLSKNGSSTTDMSHGIKSFKISLTSEFDSMFPMDAIFKNLHADNEINMIKYNPGFRRENIYRLFCNEMDDRGNIIPSMKTRDITSNIKSLAKTSGEIAMYVKSENDDYFTTLVMTFDKMGKMSVYGTTKTQVSESELEDKLKMALNPRIHNLNGYLELTGYKINEFESFNDKHVSIEELQLECIVQTTKKVKDIIENSCMKVFFAVDMPDADGSLDMKMRYKRVDNYREPGVYEYILLQVEKGIEELNVILDIKDRYKLSMEDATYKFFEAGQDDDNDIAKHRKNNGFSTLLYKSDRNITFDIKGIPSFECVDLVIDRVERLIQHVKKKNEPLKKICDSLNDYKQEEIIEPIVEERTRIDDVKINYDEKSDYTGFLSGLHKTGKTKVDEDIAKIIENNNNNMIGFADDDDEEEEDDGFFGDSDEEEDEEDEDVTGGAKNDKIRCQGVLVPRSIDGTQKDEIVKKFENKKIYGLKNSKGEIKNGIKIIEDTTNKGKWHLCSRYWDLTEHTELTEEEVLNKTKLTTEMLYKELKNVKKFKKDYDIKFNYDSAKHTSINEYTHLIPYYKGERTRDGEREGELPCCGTKYKQPSKNKKDTLINKKMKSKYITYKRNLTYGQWGFMSTELEHLFHIDINEVSDAGGINKDTKTLLRRGVMFVKNQSFISCLFEVYNDLHPKTKTIRDFKNTICERITVDNYMFFNNGSLYPSFLPDGNIDELFDKLSNKIHEHSSLFEDIININDAEYKITDVNTMTALKNNLSIFHKSVIISMYNFKDYITNDDTIIDHKFLIDVLTKRDDYGIAILDVNIVIFEHNHNNAMDIKVPLTNGNPNNEDRKTMLIFKDTTEYVPLFLYDNNKAKMLFDSKATESENEDDKWHEDKISNVISDIFKFVKDESDTFSTNEQNAKIDKGYTYPIKIENIISHLRNTNYSIDHQIVNHSFIVVGLVIKNVESDLLFYIPCQNEPPVMINDEILIDHVDGITEYYNSFEETQSIYKNFKNDTKINIVLKKPLYMENADGDNEVRGFLTNTYQYVKINSPFPYDSMDLSDRTNSTRIDEYLSADIISSLPNKPDDTRLRNSINIQLETNYYNVFRTVLRDECSDTSNRAFVNKLKVFLTDYNSEQDISVKKTIKTKVENEIRTKISGHFTFKREDYEKPRTTIINRGQKNKEGKYDKITIPKQNLMNNELNNEIFYYKKITDEIIRYPHVRNFLLEPQHYLNLTEDVFKINDDELLLLESVLLASNFVNTNVKIGSLKIPFSMAEPQQI
jgi:hypothetical protein